MSSFQQSKQQQEQKKQLLLNNYIDQLLSLQVTGNSSKNVNQQNSNSRLKKNKMSGGNHNNHKINLMELFDLLIWVQKKKPQLLQNVLEMNILSKCVELLVQDMIITQIKAFILLINNCKVNGEIIMYLLVNKLLDQILWNYLQALSSQSKNNNQQIDQQLQYLGSLLKAINNHLTTKTYMYFMNPPQTLIKNKDNHKIQDNQVKSSFKSIKSNQKSKKQEQYLSANKHPSFDPNDIFNTFDDMIVLNSINSSSNTDKSHQRQHQHQNQHLNSQQLQLQPNLHTTLPPSSCSKFHPIIYKQCLLIKVCTRFYNCPQELTKTTVMNILMNIFRQPFASQLIIDPTTLKPFPFILQWSYNMCCMLRNQLKNFNQQLMVLEPSQQWMYMQEINDKVLFWEDLTQGELAHSIFGENFMQLVIYSLIIGSLNTYSLPMFNIKFTFFILAKLIKVCSNITLLQSLSSLLFLKNEVTYFEHWVSTAVMKGFDAKEILNDKYYQIDPNQEDQVNQFSGINDFFFNILKSKDQHFLQISSNILHTLVSTVRKDQKTLKSFNDTLGFTLNGPTLVKITSTLIGQLKFDHSLKTLKQICETIIFLHTSKQLSQQNSNQFVYFYAECITQTLDLLQKGNKLWPYLTETFEYDMKILGMLKFNHKPLTDKELLIHPSQRVAQQKMNQKEGEESQAKISFYNTIPEFPSEILRFKIVKSYLMLKFNEMMIQQHQNAQILSKYVEKLRIWQEKQLKAGDKIPYPLKQKFHQCKIVQQKTQIPWYFILQFSVLIEDDVYLILGFIEANNVKIIVNAKLKHVKVQLSTKKEKTYIKLSIHKFEYERENIFLKSTILLKGFEQGIQYFSIKKENFKEKQLNSIRKGLKRTIENLPQISLL